MSEGVRAQLVAIQAPDLVQGHHRRGGKLLPTVELRQQLDRERFEAITSDDDASSRTTPLGERPLTDYLASGRSLTLTDDFVPVDQLLATLFIERGH